MSDVGLITVAEDLEWLGSVWRDEPEKLLDADVRRGAATLRRLLIDNSEGAIMRAWRRLALPNWPTIQAPDVLALLLQQGKPMEHVVSLVAGGASVNGMSVVAIGLHRVRNPDTGVAADAEEGFAVEVSSISRLAAPGPLPPSPYNNAVSREWKLRDYVDSAGAIRRGKIISRRDVIQFFCKDAGGVHVDDLFATKRNRTEPQMLAAELNGKVHADWRNGLVYELLSIGNALGHSADLAKLASSIRLKS